MALVDPAQAKLLKRVKSRSDNSLAFIEHCLRNGIDRPNVEYRFHPTRRWRLDYAWPDYRIALEVEGGIWTAGRHTTGSGFKEDMVKYNELAITGKCWRLLRCEPKDLFSENTLRLLKAVMTPTRKRILDDENKH